MSFDFTFEDYQSFRLWVPPEDAADIDLYVSIRKYDQDGDEVKFHGYTTPLEQPMALGYLRLFRRMLDDGGSTPWNPYLDDEAPSAEVESGEPVECHVPIRPSGAYFREGETLKVEIANILLGREELGVTYLPQARPDAAETIEYHYSFEDTLNLSTTNNHKDYLAC